jgi:glucose/arabinose dehydrogenase
MLAIMLGAAHRVRIGILLVMMFAVTWQLLGAQDNSVSYRVERVIEADFPVALAFAPDGRIFYTEKQTGNVRVINADGSLQAEPVLHLDTDSNTERGMLGITLDPDYERNGYVWIIHTAPGDRENWPANNIVRFREKNGLGSDPVVMLSVPIIDGSTQHNGGNLHFDDAGYLYVSVGDYQLPANSQDILTIPGKIHRFQVQEDRLEIPDDNPFPELSVYAYGLRNPFDFTIDSVTGQIFATDNGQDCDDEVNLIEPGGNYGWREQYACLGMSVTSALLRYEPPLASFTPTIAVTGITVYNHPAVQQWQGQLFFCAWNTGQMQRLILNEARNAVEETHLMDLQGFLCQIDVEVGLEGAIYFTDAAGIYRLVPAGVSTN